MSEVTFSSQLQSTMVALGGATSVQLKFAALQMALASSNKGAALEKIDKITKDQDAAKQCAAYIQQALQLQTNAESNTDGAKGNCSEMPADMKAFFDEHNLATDRDANDEWHNKDQWEFNIAHLKTFQETLGANTQQEMVFVNDFMGQYNSYLQGASTMISQSNQTLVGLAKGQ